MKKMFIVLFLFLYIHGYSQQFNNYDTLRWWWNGKGVSEEVFKDSLRAWNKWWNVAMYERQKQIGDSIVNLYIKREKNKRKTKK